MCPSQQSPTSNISFLICDEIHFVKSVSAMHGWWAASALPLTLQRQNGRHFPDDIFKWIFLIENVWISIHISLKFVLKGLINNIPALVQAMAWRRPGDKPLSEPMMVSLLTHICVTRPQWVNKRHGVKHCRLKRGKVDNKRSIVYVYRVRHPPIRRGTIT